MFPCEHFDPDGTLLAAAVRELEEEICCPAGDLSVLTGFTSLELGCPGDFNSVFLGCLSKGAGRRVQAGAGS